MLLRAARVDHAEQRGIDAVRPGGQHRELAALLAAVGEERPRVLEVVATHRAAEDVIGRDRAAVGRDDQPDLALRDHRHGHLAHAELPRPIPEVEARRERLRLVAGLSLERDQPARRQRAAGELLDHHADLTLADHDDAEPPGESSVKSAMKSAQNGCVDTNDRKRIVIAHETRALGRTPPVRETFAVAAEWEAARPSLGHLRLGSADDTQAPAAVFGIRLTALESNG